MRAIHRMLVISGGTILAACGLASAADLQSNTPVTFTKDVAPIFQEKCQECHRKGSMAPMSLVTYDEARPWAKSIRQRVIARQMPPWHIDKNVGVAKFKNDISLSDEQINKVVRWVDAGAPQGDPKDMPPPKQWPGDSDWRAARGTRASRPSGQIRIVHHAGEAPGVCGGRPGIRPCI